MNPTPEFAAWWKKIGEPQVSGTAYTIIQKAFEDGRAESATLREALLPFSKVRDTVPVYVIPNLPNCNITATLPAQVWQAAKDAIG